MPLEKFGDQILKFSGHFSEFGHQTFFKGFTQNSTPIKFYVDSENIQTLLRSIILNEINCPQLSRYFHLADIHRECEV